MPAVASEALRTIELNKPDAAARKRRHSFDRRVAGVRALEAESETAEEEERLGVPMLISFLKNG
jgi:hypothetical protein